MLHGEDVSAACLERKNERMKRCTSVRHAALWQECAELRLGVPGMCLGVPGIGAGKRCEWWIQKPLESATTAENLRVGGSIVRFRLWPPLNHGLPCPHQQCAEICTQDPRDPRPSATYRVIDLIDPTLQWKSSVLTGALKPFHSLRARYCYWALHRQRSPGDEMVGGKDRPSAGFHAVERKERNAGSDSCRGRA